MTAAAQRAPTATKARPIIFGAESVRAILAGTKSQTRRVVSPMNGQQRGWLTPAGINRAPSATVCRSQFDDPHAPLGVELEHPGGGPLGWVRCPFGEPGDKLWVRETWALLTGNGHRIVYRADADPPMTCGGTEPVRNMKWRSLVTLPRAKSRLTLEVTGVRVERLQDISEEDARAEGVATAEIPATVNGEPGRVWTFGEDAHRKAFAMGWDGINGRDGRRWADNPWVFVVAFRRVEEGRS